MKNYTFKYQLSSSDSNFPARVVLFDKPGRDCFIDKHWHKTFEMNYVISGDLVVEVEDEKQVLHNGEYAVINPYNVHMSDGKYSENYVKFLVVIYSYGFLKNYFDDFEDFSYVVKTEKDKEFIKSQFERIASIINTDDSLEELTVLSALISMIDYIFTNCRTELKQNSHIYRSSNSVYNYSQVAIDYIKEHYREPITLENAAKEVGLSTTYFSKIFKVKTNKTFMNYLNEYRMFNAISDMVNYDVTETAAALDNGFPNVKAFINAFKRTYNCTLREYVREHNHLPDTYAYSKFYESNNYVN